jgi:1-deoxy-D-xylulose 5-phosphate reductoisomerase
VAVAAFLDGLIRFDQIPQVIEKVLGETKTTKLESIRQVLEADTEARQLAREKAAQLGSNSTLRPVSAVVTGK